MSVMEVNLLQWDLVWENPEANFARVRELLESTPAKKDSLLILPEMFATGFSMNPAIIEPYEGPTMDFLATLAGERGALVIGGLALNNQGRNVNVAAAFGPYGTPCGLYEKQRPFVPGGEVYTPGYEPFLMEWEGTELTLQPPVCPFVCYDLRFPELFREAARRWQPEVFVVIASWPEARVSHWLALLQARAIENQAFVIGVNRTGTDPYFRYPGRSVVYDFSGACLADAGDSEGVTHATLDLGALREYRTRLPFLKDLR